ncbi:hypothetical protein [Streptomyces sp. NPDC003090]|uniref:hypothetical protein n=1 Tax=Streptomyces sp. NPDC003090 TaxID=3154274 RepID=UPI00382B30FE
MVTADDIARQVGAALREEYRERLRRLLLQQPKEWLADELIDRLDRPDRPAARPRRCPAQARRAPRAALQPSWRPRRSPASSSRRST